MTSASGTRVAARDLARESADRGGELGGRPAVEHQRVAEAETGQRPPQVGGLDPGVGDDDRQEPSAVVDRDRGAARRLRLERRERARRRRCVGPTWIAPVTARAAVAEAPAYAREWTIAARPGRSTSTPQSTTLRRPITLRPSAIRRPSDRPSVSKKPPLTTSAAPACLPQRRRGRRLRGAGNDDVGAKRLEIETKQIDRARRRRAGARRRARAPSTRARRARRRPPPRR